MRIRGRCTGELGTFGTSSPAPYDIISGEPNPQAGPCSNGQANQRVSRLVALRTLPGNAENVFVRQHLLTCRMSKRNSVVAQRLELAFIDFDIHHHDANFLTRRQEFEIVPPS